MRKKEEECVQGTSSSFVQNECALFEQHHLGSILSALKVLLSFTFGKRIAGHPLESSPPLFLLPESALSQGRGCGTSQVR